MTIAEGTPIEIAISEYTGIADKSIRAKILVRSDRFL